MQPYNATPTNEAIGKVHLKLIDLQNVKRNNKHMNKTSKMFNMPPSFHFVDDEAQNDARQTTPEAVLWRPDAISALLVVLRQATNRVTLEAAAGAIQNLSAPTQWPPALLIRSEVTTGPYAHLCILSYITAPIIFCLTSFSELTKDCCGFIKPETFSIRKHKI